MEVTSRRVEMEHVDTTAVQLHQPPCQLLLQHADWLRPPHKPAQTSDPLADIPALLILPFSASTQPSF
jgi:hypothetical protein